MEPWYRYSRSTCDSDQSAWFSDRRPTERLTDQRCVNRSPLICLTPITCSQYAGQCTVKRDNRLYDSCCGNCAVPISGCYGCDSVVVIALSPLITHIVLLGLFAIGNKETLLGIVHEVFVRIIPIRVSKDHLTIITTTTTIIIIIKEKNNNNNLVIGGGVKRWIGQDYYDREAKRHQ